MENATQYISHPALQYTRQHPPHGLQYRANAVLSQGSTELTQYLGNVYSMIPMLDIRLDHAAKEPEEKLYELLGKVRPAWNKDNVQIKVSECRTKTPLPTSAQD